MPYRLLAILLALFSVLLAFPLVGQEQCPAIRLVDVGLNPVTGDLRLDLLARDADCGIINSLDQNDVQVIEGIALKDTQRVSITEITYDPIYDTVDLKADTVQLLFLLDRSELTTKKDIDAQITLINNFFNQYEEQLGANAFFYLSTFGADPGPVVGGESGDFIGRLVREGSRPGRPDLFRALIYSLHALEELPGQKFLFLFSKGDHVPNSDRYSPEGARLPPGIDLVLNKVENLGKELYLFPISPDLPSEEGEELLERLTNQTVYLDDVVSAGYLPRELDWTIKNQSRLVRTHRATAVSNSPIFKGELREYCLYENARNSPDCKEFRAGSWSNPAGPVMQADNLDYLSHGLAGAVGILLLLGVFALLFPQIRQWQFQREHVVPFQPQPGRTVFDPATREPIAAGELVVDICRMPIPLTTWKECDNQCPHFPECTKNTLQCKGEGVQTEQPFFRPTGNNRTLNWIWFGAAGGFLGWVLFALIDLVLSLGQHSLGGMAEKFVRQYTEGASVNSLVSDGVIGACFGTGLILLLSIMEERTQSDKFSPGRILLRTLIGALLSLLTFGAGFLLQATGFIAYPLLAAALTWTVFGLVVGLVMVINSSIIVKRGIIGGLLAGLAGFVIYWFISGISDDFLLAKLLSLILAGAVLGWVLDTVINLAEDYYIEILQPSEYSRNRVPLSKWLKTDYEIVIGTLPGSQVYIKWPDEEVEAEHARIKLDGGRVFLVPYGETLINNRIITGQKRVQLNDNDIIRLGRRSITEMRYRERSEMVLAN